MKHQLGALLKSLGKKTLNNIFYIIGFLCCFLPPLILILVEGVRVRPEGWALNVGFIIPLLAYLIVFFKFFRGRIRIKLGKWEAVNEIDNTKHIGGILAFTLIDYLSYLMGLVLAYLIVSLLIDFGTNIAYFFIFWVWWFLIGIAFMYVDKVRHILNKGLINENEENEIITEKVEKPRKKR